MRVILVPVADRPECAVALNRSFALARDLDASVIGFHIRPPGEKSTGSATGSEAEWLALMRPRSRKSSVAAARSLFAHASRANGYDLHKSPRAKPGAMWMEKSGSPSRVIAASGPVADLLVVSRPVKRDGSVARLFLTAALMASARPVLVLPQGGEYNVGRRMCIAWNQSTEAARAVASALPLLQLAQHVTIVAAGAEKRPGPKSSKLANYLKCWGIKSERVTTAGDDDARELLGAYRTNKCDLMVMGAYSRNRFSQMVFGGVTEFMLYHASIPVIALHS
jgi:nucleotide-binding universal stress UspA family protein